MKREGASGGEARHNTKLASAIPALILPLLSPVCSCSRTAHRGVARCLVFDDVGDADSVADVAGVVGA